MIIRALRHIFPKTHVHPHRPVHEWKGWERYDDAVRPLEEHEHGCGPANELRLFWDYELHGRLKRRKVVVG